MKKGEKNSKRSFTKKRVADELSARAQLENATEDAVKIEKTADADADTEEDTDNITKVNSKRIKTELTSIYENADGSMPDMSSFETKKHNRFLRAIIFFVFSLTLLSAIMYAGLFYIGMSGNFSKDDILLSIKGNETVRNGESASYRITYRNAQAVPIAQAKLQVRYPDGFVFERASIEPQNEAKNEWSLGTLNKDDKGYIDIIGKIYGNAGDDQSLRVFFTYLPANFSSEFQAVETFVTTMATDTIAVNIDSADSTAVGSDMMASVRIKPANEKEVLTDVFVVFEGSSSFTLVSSTPTANNNNTHLLVLSPIMGEVVIPFIARFTDGEQGSVKVLVYQKGKQSDEDVLLGQSEKIIALENTQVSISYALNGAIGDTSAMPGDMLNNTITIKNTLATKVTDAVVSLSFDTPSAKNMSMMKWNEIVDTADGTITGEQIDTDARRGTITWTKRQLPALASLDPNETITIDVSLPIKSMEDADLTTYIGNMITILPSVSFKQNTEVKEISSKAVQVTINSDTSLIVKHDITNNRHAVTWLISNTYHDLSDVTLEADVFGDIIWQESMINAGAGAVAFDAEQKRITWKIDSMPTSVDVNALQFALDLRSDNPSQTNLTSKVRFKATDSVTGQEIILVGDEIRLR